MSWRKRIAISLGAFGALVLAILGALTWVMSSERGTAWLITTFVSAPPAFTVGRIEGTLLDGVALGDVTIITNADRIEARDVELTLAWSSLLERAIVIERFHASTVSYSRGPRTGPARQWRLPELSFTAEIRAAEIGSLTIEAAQESLTLTDLAFSTQLADGELVAGRIEALLEDAELRANMTLNTRDGLRLAAGIDWSVPNGSMPAAGRFLIEGTLPELDVRHELEAPYAISTAGKLWVESPPRIALGFQWAGIAIPGREDLGSIRGEAGVEGTVDALRFGSNGVLATPEGELTYNATGSIDALVARVEPLEITGPGGSVSIVGDIELDTLGWTAAVEGRGLNPGVYDARFPGNIDLAAELNGTFRPFLRVFAEEASLSGTLRGFPFAATAAGAFVYPNLWRVDALELSGEGDVVHARGTVADELDLVVDASVESLGRWLPGINGAVDLDATLNGTPAAPRIAGTLEARGIESRGYRLGSASLVGTVEAEPGGALEIALTADEVNGPGLATASVRAGVDGTMDAHDIDVALENPRMRSSLEAHGGLDAGIWSGVIESVAIRETAFGDWNLKNSAELEVGRNHAVLAPMCLVQSTTDVCAELRLTGAVDDEVAFSATNFDLRALQPFLPENVSLSGVYELSAVVTDLRGAQRGHVNLSGGATHVRLSLGEQDALDQMIDSVTLNAELDAGRLDLNFALDGGDAGRVDLEAVVADLRNPSSSVDGMLGLEWRDLESLALLSPDIGSVAGALSANLDFGGTLAEPELEGRAELTDGTIEVPQWELRIDDISGTAVTVDGRLLEYSGSGHVGGEELHVTGTTELDPARNWPTRLNITGESLEVVRRADATIWASPDLDIEVALPDITVEGTVHIPRAVIALEQLPAQAVRPSADATVHGGVAEAEPARPLHVRADVRVTLGDDVRYNAAGLQTEVEGELALHYESGLTPSAAGSLRLTGTYNAYGQLLTLQRGELLFAGPLTDPAIDVRAGRTIGETTTVGVQLTGALKSPVTRIYSEPAMSEADALSYLLLGRPLSGTGDEETATLESAAVAMGLQQALPAVQRIGTTLGLDELSIQTTDADTGALTAGKYLSARLYVRYSYGLFSRIGGLLVRFSFNDRLDVEARSGDEDSVDLLYTVEKE
jgi:translocation and assembly module TamB